MIDEEKRKVQLEALEALKQNDFNGTFILPTGTGKSWVLIESLKTLLKEHPEYEEIWYLCNSTDLRDFDFVKELENWKAEDLIPKIKRMCYQTAYKIKDVKVDVLLADEYDYSLSEKYSNVYFNNSFKHKILTTAFIDSDKMDLAEDISEVVYKKQLQDAEDENVLNKSKYFYVNFLMTEEETKRYLEFNKEISDIVIKLNDLKLQLSLADDIESYRLSKKIKLWDFRLDIAIRARKRFLNSLDSSSVTCRKLMKEIYNEDPKCKILTFCELTKQADKVSKYSYHGESSSLNNLEKFRNDEIQSLSVCGKINRGVNIKNVRYMIFESCNQSKTQITQRLGRGKRLGKDDFLNVYFLIPCYYENGKIKYTKVKEWINNASKRLNMSSAKNYRFKS